MGRRAVAATIVSVVVFTMMLVANAAVYSSQQGYLSSARLSSAQVLETGYASVLVAASAFSVLAQVQSFLQSTPMDCSAPQAYLGSISGTGTYGGTEQGISYSQQASWNYLSSGSLTTGNALMSPQFNGYASGDLNVEVASDLSETYLGGLPSYSTDSLQVVHLNIQPEAAATTCTLALADLGDGLSSLSSCSSSLVAQQASLARSRYPLLGSFESGASASVIAGRCSVSYWVRTSLAGTGVSGTFEWTVFGSGSLELAVPVVSPPSAS